jgi:DNA-binding response OmpR family regulator
MRHLWESEYVADSRTVDVHVRSLRRKIERDATTPERLVSVRGYGYRMWCRLSCLENRWAPAGRAENDLRIG